MAGATKHQKPPLQPELEDPNKFYYHFFYKATLVLIFFVIFPLFPSQAPEFINQSLLTRNWELLHLLFVGVVISYGLFSRRNHEADKEHNNSKFDTAQTLVSRFLQVSSFEDEVGTEFEDPKVQMWSNQHHSNESAVLVAPRLEKHSSFDGKSGGEKPLLLPIRSLKSRLSDEEAEDALDKSMSSKRFSSNSNRKPKVEEAEDSLDKSMSSKRFSSNSNRKPKVEEADDSVDIDADADADVQSLNRPINTKRFSSNSSRNEEFEAVDVDVQSINRSTSSKRFSSNSKRNAEVEGSRVENKKKESVVLPSPIPWRSRSGRMEPKQEEVVEASNTKSQQSHASSRASSSMSPSPNITPSPSFSSESLAKNAEDLVRKKSFHKSCPPPPPPPPPPMMFQKSVTMKPRHVIGSFNEEPSFNKELKRSFTSERHVTPETRRKSDEEKQSMQTTSFMGHASVPLVSEKETFLVESDDDDDDDDDMDTEDEDVVGEIISVQNNNESSKPASGTRGDEGPDVDKKADEFIAKFREQIRLQRIESIKRGTRSARNSSR